MRVTSNMMFAAGVGALQNKQQEMMKVQEQSSTGMKINRPSDDPSGTFRHLLFSTDLTGVQSLQKTSNLATQRLNMGDVKIGNIHDSMLQAQDMVMKYAHSSVGGDPDLLKLFAQDATALYQDVLSLANAELDGVPIFGGGRTTSPFDESILKATSVRIQENGVGTISEGPTWFSSRASISANTEYTPPSDQEGENTHYTISLVAGQYVVAVNGVKQDDAVPVTVESGQLPYLDLGDGAIFTLAGSPREGDVYSFDVVPDGEVYRTTTVQRQGGGGAASVIVDVDYQPPDEESGNLNTSVQVIASAGQYNVYVNGTVQETPLTAIEEAGRPPYLELGNGIILNLGAETREGDMFSFTIEPVDTSDEYASTPVQLRREGGEADLTDYYAGYTATIAEHHNINEVPLSVKVSYLAANQEFEIDINGVTQPRQRASFGEPPTLNLGNGITLNVAGQPSPGDTFYFEVIPDYKGGSEDRPIQITNGKKLPGNMTGSELMEGSGPLGRNVNILGSLAALRGAFLRANPDEVAAQLDRIREGGAQTSDFQAITGVRGVQVAATNAILVSDEASLQEARANNSEVDLFDVISRLQQTSQTMQTMATAERQILNTSLIDFIS